MSLWASANEGLFSPLAWSSTSIAILTSDSLFLEGAEEVTGALSLRGSANKGSFSHLARPATSIVILTSASLFAGAVTGSLSLWGSTDMGSFSHALVATALTTGTFRVRL
jgi:hypothetical protein